MDRVDSIVRVEIAQDSEAGPVSEDRDREVVLPAV
jgi:hypothetical protein